MYITGYRLKLFLAESTQEVIVRLEYEDAVFGSAAILLLRGLNTVMLNIWQTSSSAVTLQI